MLFVTFGLVFLYYLSAFARWATFFLLFAEKKEGKEKGSPIKWLVLISP